MRPPPIFFSKRLRNHRAQRLRQHRTHHLFFGRREHVDNTVDGLRRRTGMQSTEHQVTGFGRGQRKTNGLEVTQLTNQDNIGVFAQRRAQCLVEAKRVAMNFALVDQATFWIHAQIRSDPQS